jgi:hypothetical protein
MRQPLGVLNDRIEVVAMREPQSPAIGQGVLCFLEQLHATKLMVHKLPSKLIVVAWHVNNPRALSRATQQLLNHIVVSLGPMPSSLELPTVNNVAQQIKKITAVVF